MSALLRLRPTSSNLGGTKNTFSYYNLPRIDFVFLSLECASINKKISLLFYPAILSNNINRFKIFTSSKKHIPGKENRQKKSEITNRNITWNKVLRVPPHFFQSLCSSHFGLTLIRVMIGLKKIRATKTFSTNHNSPAFSRAWNQQNVFASCSDWFTELTTCFLIGQSKPTATFSHSFPAPDSLNSDWFTKSTTCAVVGQMTNTK